MAYSTLSNLTPCLPLQLTPPTLWIPFLLPRTPPSLGMAASYYLILQVSCEILPLLLQEDFSDHHASRALQISRLSAKPPQLQGPPPPSPTMLSWKHLLLSTCYPSPTHPSHHYHHPLHQLVVTLSFLLPCTQLSRGSAVLLDQRMNESNPYPSSRRVCFTLYLKLWLLSCVYSVPLLNLKFSKKLY